jgi:Flp pilus assembly pilin Flp
MKHRVHHILKRSLAAFKSKEGQTLVEYALILAMISVVAISVLINLGTELRGVYSKIDSGVAYAASSH